MSISLSQSDSVNVLMSNSYWAWPQAVQQIFQPCGVNVLMANDTNDIMKIIDNRKVHLAIIDNSIDNESGLKALDIIRKQDKLMPCLLLAGEINDKLLAGALKLNACSVLAKPVNIVQLANQMNKIFRKYYSCDIFGQADDVLGDYMAEHKIDMPGKKISFRMSIKRNK